MDGVMWVVGEVALLEVEVVEKEEENAAAPAYTMTRVGMVSMSTRAGGHVAHVDMQRQNRKENDEHVRLPSSRKNHNWLWIIES
jgi:hypothetical protein